ncbi:hypothetical protein GCM10025880_60550 [Methylorubrum aminovorans]|nr:hypothetical protein GCM10025880_60550 [Methylorubrum aminovorans]
MEGSFEAGSGQIQFPNVTVRSGGNTLEGAGSAVLGPRRTAVQATLAAETLNLSPLLGGVLRLTGFDHADDATWRARSLDLRPFIGGDLDLRISAGNARIGPVQLTDLASSVLVREDGIEASLGRANLSGGMVKGRISFAADEGDAAPTRIKAQEASTGSISALSWTRSGSPAGWSGRRAEASSWRPQATMSGLWPDPFQGGLPWRARTVPYPASTWPM